MNTESENLWRGTSSDERAAERRGRLVAACRQIVGSDGSAALTVRAVCRVAGVGPKNFYAGFPDTDALLLATYDRAVAQLLSAVAAAAIPVADEQNTARGTLRHVFEAAVAHLEQHPDEGRIIFAEALTNDVLRTRATVTLPAFLEGVGQLVPMPTGEPGAFRRGGLTSTLLSGALAAVFIEWLSGTVEFSRDELIDRCTDFTWRTLSN